MKRQVPLFGQIIQDKHTHTHAHTRTHTHTRTRTHTHAHTHRVQSHTPRAQLSAFPWPPCKCIARKAKDDGLLQNDTASVFNRPPINHKQEVAARFFAVLRITHKQKDTASIFNRSAHHSHEQSKQKGLRRGKQLLQGPSQNGTASDKGCSATIYIPYIHTLYTYIVYTIHTLYTYIVYTIHTLYTYIVYDIHTLYTYIAYNIHTLYTRDFWQEYFQIYGHIRRICAVLANPTIVIQWCAVQFITHTHTATNGVLL